MCYTITTMNGTLNKLLVFFAISFCVLTPVKAQPAAIPDLNGEIRRAVDKGELLLYIQPIYNLKDLQVAGGEALVRWQHPEKGLIMPNDFVNRLEESDDIMLLDFYMFETLCKQIKKWETQKIKQLPVSINFSQRTLRSPDITQKLKNIADTHKVDPKFIEIEVMESLPFIPITDLSDNLNKLRSVGFPIAIDDFGAGYTSFDILKHLPATILKLDKSITKSEAPVNTFAIKSIITAKTFNMLIVAEGIETEQDSKHMLSIGCDYGQGYYFSKPLPAKDFTELISKR